MACPQEKMAILNQAALREDLLTWFAEARRDLPWRDSADLYGIWISEIMLQQTTVQTVIPYWERFLSRFPNVASLAAADESAVLSLWSGLGYYSRARNLHRTARLIQDRYGTGFPPSYAAWLELPGVGPYAAGAIASMGLGEPVPALDANARRVLGRWAVTDPGTHAALPASRRQRLIDELGAALVPVGEPGRWNEALMELGALICKAGQAHCQACPVARHCRAALGGWTTEVPPPKQKSRVQPVWVGLCLVTWRGRVLLVPSPLVPLPGVWPGRSVARRDFRNLHVGLWGVPMSSWLAGHETPDIDWDSWRTALDQLGKMWPAGTEGVTLGSFNHAVTRYRLKVTVYLVVLPPQVELPSGWLADADSGDGHSRQGIFLGKEGRQPPLSALAEKALHFHQDSVV